MVQQKQKCVVTSAESKNTGKRKVTVGSIWESKGYGSFEVVKYKSCHDVTVRFLDTGFEVSCRSGNIKVGNVKDRLSPKVHGVGFVGVGAYKSDINGVRAKSYETWVNMLARCYSNSYKNKYPTYKDCKVCDEWHNYQNFAKWFYENLPKDGNTYHLDKDLKVIGNNIYSPITCMFVTPVVNLFTTDRGAARGCCMIGASLSKIGGNFKSQCKEPFTGKHFSIGYFDTELEAHLAWRKRKSELAYELAMTQDREEVKQALLNWKEALDNKLIHPY